MPSPTHELYRRSVLEWFRAHGHEPDVAQTLSRYKDAVLVLWHLDLEPARRILRDCYASKPRGGDPWPPLVILRCLLLAALAGEPRINLWVPMLRASRVLRVLCGLPADGDSPGVGTFYDFLHRLHDGPVRRDCEHQQRPSEAQRRRARTPRAPRKKPEKPKLTREQKRERKRRRQRDAVTADVIELSATEKVLAELKATRDNPNPNDLLGRRERAAPGGRRDGVGAPRPARKPRAPHRQRRQQLAGHLGQRQRRACLHSRQDRAL